MSPWSSVGGRRRGPPGCPKGRIAAFPQLITDGSAGKFGAGRRQIFFKVSLPSAMPFILAGLKLGIGRGLIGVVVAELFGSRAGLGRLISQSADAFNMPELFAGVVVLAFAGIVLTAGFTWLEGKLVPWTKD